MKNKIAILVINYETPELTKNLMNQIKTFDESKFDLTIWDNSSSNKMTEATELSTRNLGFDQTVLKWLSCKEDYAGYWLLNSDCVLDLQYNYLDKFLNLINHADNIGIVTTKVNDTLNGFISPQRITQKGIFLTRYSDLQSAVLSNSFVKAFLKGLKGKKLNYFHGGLDLDFALFAERENFLILVDSTMEINHLVGKSTDKAIPINDFTNFLIERFGNLSILDKYTNSTDTIRFNEGNAELLSATLIERYSMPVPENKTPLKAVIELKSKKLQGQMVDWGIINFNNGIKLFNEIKYAEAIPYLKIAAYAGIHQAYAYLSSCYDQTGRFSEGSEFFKPLVNLEVYDDVRSRYEYLTAQRDTYEVVKRKQQLIVFYVKPDAGHTWDADNTEKGIGGSEIAVIQLSKELAKLGHLVYVFNNCGNPKIIDGVAWEPIEKFDAFEKINEIHTLIVSRLPEFRFVNPKTKVYFWAHDLNYYNRINPININYFDKFLVLSRYHYRFFTAAYPFIPTSKMEIFANGLDLSRFNQKVERIPTKLIYSSNPDRGMTELIPIFEELKKWDNRLELHVFGYYPDNIRKHPNYWKETPGLIYRGYHNQKDLAKEYMSSKLWLYPCTWLETFCITAIEAQAAGTPAVASDWGCLRERVGNAGIIVDGWIKNKDHRENFINAVKHLLTNDIDWYDYHQKGLEQSKNLSWINVAKRFLELGDKL